MIDLSNIRAPGWQRVVAELVSPAPDDRVFLMRLLAVLGQVAGARQAILWTVPSRRDESPAGPEPAPVMMWPFGTDADATRAAQVDENAIDQAQDTKAAARGAASSGQTRAFGLEARDGLYDAAQATGYVLAVPVFASGTQEHAAGAAPMGVITMVLDGRSRQALQTTVALVEVLAGYAFAHSTGQQLRRAKTSAASLELATRLIASINSSGMASHLPNAPKVGEASGWSNGFKACALQFVNDVCRLVAVDRVALGWVRGPGSIQPKDASSREQRRQIRIVALSDTEQLDRRMAMVQKLEAAMDECMDQEQTVLYPPPPAEGPGADAVLSQAVTHAHRDLAAADARLRVASFPLRVPTTTGDMIVGVVVVESGAADAGTSRLDLQVVELIQAALDLVAPVLSVRHSDDRAIALRTWDWLMKVAAWAVGPSHTAWKVAGIALMLATSASIFVTTTYRIGAPVELRAKEKRVISAPFEGTIASIEPASSPGSTIEPGMVLVKLDATSRRLSALEARSQVNQFEAEADEALRKGDNAEAAQARAKAAQAQAKLDLLEWEVDRATITAPIQGVVVLGDLGDKVGASVKLGDTLLEVADLSEMRIIARVADRDIAFITEETTGEFSPKSDPSRAYAFKVERIVPLSQAVEGQNAFEVHALLSVPGTGALRPGMEGQARFNGPDRSLAWIASRRVIDQLRVWLWW